MDISFNSTQLTCALFNTLYKKNLLLTIENEEKKKKLASISVKNLQFIFIIFFFVAKQQIYPVSYQVRI